MDYFTEGEPIRDTAAPDGPIETRWERRREPARDTVSLAASAGVSGVVAGVLASSVVVSA
jgi:hypothetical protein